MDEENKVAEQPNENQQADAKPADEKVALSPEAQAKFNQIYKEAKTAKERAALLESHTIKLQEATKRLQERLDASEKRDAIDGLKSQLRTARENGDEESVDRIQEKLTELMVEEKLNKKIKSDPLPSRQDEMTQAAIQLSTSEQKITAKWANEVDEDGEYLRPWAALESHPKSSAAADYLAELLGSEEHFDLTIKEKLALVDEKFGRKTLVKRNFSAVGEGSLTKPSEKNDIKLSPEQKRVAWMMFSKLSRDEAEKQYLDGLKMTGAK